MLQKIFLILIFETSVNISTIIFRSVLFGVYNKKLKKYVSNKIYLCFYITNMETEDTEVDELTRRFFKYAKKIQKIETVEDIDKLYLYTRYKQALNGDNCNPKPSILDRIAMEKWKGWNALHGMSKEEAMDQYIVRVKKIRKEHE